MPRIVTYSRPVAYPYGGAQYSSLDVFLYSEGSPRINGKLQLQAHPWSLNVTETRATNFHGGGPAPILYPNFEGSSNDPQILRARAVAESDLRGQLARKVRNKEFSNLGVSIASSGQTIDMMRGASTRLTGIFAAAEHFYQTTRGTQRLKRFRRLINRGGLVTPGLVLEGFFGWKPLIEDWAGAAKVLANPWPNSSWLSSGRDWSVKGTSTRVQVSDWLVQSASWSATGRESYSCNVSVTNPNLWVGNKLGLVNPFSVAWDLVPWSFLVNMVSNMGQIMGSLTDFTGLGLHNTSSTHSVLLTEDAHSSYRDPRPNAFSTADGTRFTKVRGRVVGVSPPQVTPYLRFPEWNVGTAAIAGSLMAQQVFRLSLALGRLDRTVYTE